jgi:hypothetical protein
MVGVGAIIFVSAWFFIFGHIAGSNSAHAEVKRFEAKQAFLNSFRTEQLNASMNKLNGLVDKIKQVHGIDREPSQASQASQASISPLTTPVRKIQKTE